MNKEEYETIVRRGKVIAAKESTELKWHNTSRVKWKKVASIKTDSCNCGKRRTTLVVFFLIFIEGKRKREREAILWTDTHTGNGFFRTELVTEIKRQDTISLFFSCCFSFLFFFSLQKQQVICISFLQSRTDNVSVQASSFFFSFLFSEQDRYKFCAINDTVPGPRS